MSSSDSTSKAAARRGSKATSTGMSSPDSASPPAAPPPAPRDTPSPESGSLSVELVNNSEALMDYNGDIRDGLIDLLDHMEEDEMVPPEEKDKTVELMYAVFHYVEFCAENNDPETEMRDTLKAIELTFDDIVFKLDRGSPYQKVINWCAMQRSKREKQQKKQKRKERAGSS